MVDLLMPAYKRYRSPRALKMYEKIIMVWKKTCVCVCVVCTHALPMCIVIMYIHVRKLRELWLVA